MRIGKREIGPGYPCFIVAEIGSNHNGSLETALDAIRAAASAGASAAKFQVWTQLYEETDPRETEARKWRLPIEWLPVLAAEAHRLGLAFICSVFDEASADAVEPYIDAYKIASLDLTNYDLLEYVGHKHKPTIISTGAGNKEELEMAYQTVAVRGDDPRRLAWLHCTVAYPASGADVNLRALLDFPGHGMWQRVPRGLSDHTSDRCVVPACAVALGASIIEKHLRLDSTPTTAPDYAHALPPAEFAEYVQNVRLAELVLGDGVKRVQPSEEWALALRRGPKGLRGA